MTKKIFSLLLALAMVMSVFSVSTVSFAADTDTPAEEEIIEEYTVIAANASTFTISGVTAKCSATLHAQYSTTLKIKIELQKKKSGVYETVKTWSKTDSGTATTLSGSKTINILGSYRMKTTFTAGSESVTVYKYP